MFNNGSYNSERILAARTKQSVRANHAGTCEQHKPIGKKKTDCCGRCGCSSIAKHRQRARLDSWIAPTCEVHVKWTRLTLPSHHRTRRLHLQPTPALAREPKTDSPQRERLLAVSEPSLDLAQGPARGSEDDHVSLLQQARHGPTAVAHPERINQAHIERTTARRQARTRRSGRIEGPGTRT